MLRSCENKLFVFYCLYLNTAVSSTRNKKDFESEEIFIVDSRMGAFCKLIDATLFIFFLIIAFVAPLIDAQTCLPQHLFPSFLVELKNWYATEYGDYLVSEKPHFFVGIAWLELLFQWPLSIACLYGIAAGRSWLNTTCLIYGVSAFTSMVTILSEMTLSKRASDKLMMMYFPFLGFGLLAFLRGLTARTVKCITIEKGPAINPKKSLK